MNRRRRAKPTAQTVPERLRNWQQRLRQRLDWAGYIAERLEPSFKNHWVPLILLAFPLLLLALALLLASLR